MDYGADFPLTFSHFQTMRSIHLFFCILVAVGLTACTTGPKFDPRSQQGAAAGQLAPYFTSLNLSNQIANEWLTPPTDFYRLGPGDTIEVEILGEPASRAAVSVGPDGKIYYSLLPGTFVWGLTLSETKNLLEESLAKFIRVRPEISLTLGTVVSKRIWVLGNVRRPGIYGLGAPMTLLEGISTAGGTVIIPGSSEELADLDKSYVMRGGKMLPVNFYKLLRQGDLSQNIYLQPDDFIYLRSAATREVSVLGAVVLPNVVGYTEQTTLLSAIATVGGTVPYAYLSRVVIVRGALTDPMVATVDYDGIRKGEIPDVRLMPGDIVYVPLRPFEKVERLASTLLDEFVRTIAINEGQNAVISGGAPVGISLPGGGQ